MKTDGMLRKYLPADERVALSLRPSLLFIIIRPFWAILLIVLTAAGLHYAGRALDEPMLARASLWVGWGLALLMFVWQAVEWLSRLYVLTDRRLIAIGGVLRQEIADVPLRKVRNIVVVRSLADRLLGLGTLGAATAGTDDYELVWAHLNRPHEVMRTVRGAVDGRPQVSPPPAAEIPEPTMTLPPITPISSVRLRPVVIGLTGGIGAGKSEVARFLSDHGFVVIDSDKEAKAALDQPPVREELVKWWGPRVVGADGRVDRRVVAEIIFGDEAQRTRLEQLVHPLVKGTRAELVNRAAREGKAGVVVDAPLLLEAGSDAECDIIVFVDAPRAKRLERVRATRGWNESELSRREMAQLPLEEKRRRSDEVLVNDASPEVLSARVAELVRNIQARFGGH
jgi:dephospho-CoA kinase